MFRTEAYLEGQGDLNPGSKPTKLRFRLERGPALRHIKSKDSGTAGVEFQVETSCSSGIDCCFCLGICSLGSRASNLGRH